jgi:hypothetical protein
VVQELPCRAVRLCHAFCSKDCVHIPGKFSWLQILALLRQCILIMCRQSLIESLRIVQLSGHTLMRGEFRTLIRSIVAHFSRFASTSSIASITLASTTPASEL